MSEDELGADAAHLVTLVARAQDGDLGSFEKLVERFETPLLRLAYRMLGGAADAEDAVQETFMGAWLKLSTLQHPEAFSTWLYRQAVHHCTDMIRARQKQRSVSLNDDDADAPEVPSQDPHADPERQAETASSMDALGALLQQLPPSQRACWVLREMQGLSYGDISAALEIPEATVRGRLARARKTLAHHMKEWR